MQRTEDDAPASGVLPYVDARVRIHAFRVPLALALVSIALAVAYLLTDWMLRSYRTDVPRIVELVSGFFNLNAEHSAPTWFSSSLWLFAALLAVSAASQSRRDHDRRRWRSLVVLFAFLSLDESAGAHEKVGNLLGDHIVLSGAFYYVWVLYGMLFLLVMVLFYARFVASLPRIVTVLIGSAAFVFLLGALGFEMLSAAVESGSTGFPAGLSWPGAIALEETFEMLGVVILIQALLLFLRIDRPSTSVSEKRGP